jgi:amidohydrolase
MDPIRQNDWQRNLNLAIEALASRLSEVRRRLHMHPEPSGEEVQTTAFLRACIADSGLRMREGPGHRGLIVDSPAPPGTPRIALRADLDALRLHDAKTVPYRSQVDGVMHACGHDVHSACALGATLGLARLLERGESPWPLSFRVIFQPAEETAEGARAMIEAGALEDVYAIFALHADPSRDVGVAAVKDGALTAHCDWLSITIRGRGGHAARPHESVDPIAAAAQLISAIYAFIPRSIDSQDPVVVTIGQIAGGYSPNVIPAEVELEGTMRTLDPAVRHRAQERLRQLARGIAEASGAAIHVDLGAGLAAVYNHPAAAAVVRDAIAAAEGPRAVQNIERPSMGGEDFAGYLERVPGAMFRLGVRSERIGGAPLHSPQFDIDERALAIGAKILAQSAVLAADPTRKGLHHDQDLIPVESGAHARR